jgi:acetylornithine deacetylase/succinyl-diaminopimelate desuccinylase-like protein
LLQQLVRVPTDTPPGDNAPHAGRTAELLAAMGLVAERHPVPAGEVRAQGMASITNLVVRRRFGDGPFVALNAHGDVVPPGEGWTHDPYGGEVVEGRLCGRAAAVSKSDFATDAFALRALDALGAAGAACALYGAGPRTVLESNAKRADEHLVLEDLREATKVVARALRDLLGSGSGPPARVRGTRPAIAAPRHGPSPRPGTPDASRPAHARSPTPGRSTNGTPP